MKQKTVILLMFVAFTLLWACTPLSLRRNSNPGATKAIGSLAKSTDVIADAMAQVRPEVAQQVVRVADSLAAQADTAAIGSVVRATADSLLADARAQADSLLAGSRAHSDSLMAQADSLIAQVGEASAKLKRDTSQMDSLELAIYRYNKVIDDSLRMDSLNRQRKNGIDAPVKYSANDSLTYEAASGRAHLYGDSHVEYQNMDLKSERIFMVLDSSVVHATGIRDSVTKRLTKTPVFKMGSDEYENDTMAFNFKTKKGLITQVYTKQEDGFLTSELAKRGSDGELYLMHGRYTTCDEPHPDFYLALSRAKVRPGKDVIFGPAYLVVADVPLPLAIPYGFFPFTKSYSSGFIMPTYGDESDRGFYLRDGGYYFAISDKMDLKVIGEIFTKGSWGFTATSNYRRRYKYNGSFLFSYQNSVYGEKNLPDYSKETSFKLFWSHKQDTKANPYSNFGAQVNFVTSSYEQNNLTSMYNPQSRTQSTRTSSVNYTTGFSSLGINLSSSMRLEQYMRDSTINLTLPNLTVTVSKFFPFKRKKMVGDERWYEKISMRYTGDISNSIHTKEDKLLHSDFRRDWQNSIKHTLPIEANFTALKYITLTPNFSFNATNSFLKTNKHWDTDKQVEVADSITGFYTTYNWSLNLTATTKLYGFYIPSRKLFGDKVQAIRHVFTPSIGFSYAPDFSADRYGFYDTYQKTDKDGNVTLVTYSPYQVNGVTPPSSGKTGSIRFDFKNNVEMKYRDKNDSIKKLSLIDELSANMSYNMAATRQPWSSLNTTLRLKLWKTTLNINAVFKSYVYEADSVGATPHESDHVTYWGQGKIGRFQGMSKNLSYTLDNTKVGNFFKWLRGEKVDKKEDKEPNKTEEDDVDLNPNIDKDMEKAKQGAKQGDNALAETDDDGYMLFKIPWSISFGYGINMSEDTDVNKFDYDRMRYPYKFTQNLNVSGNIRISDGWNITFSSGYDFENQKISMTTASLSRDLHCFNMSCQVTLAPYTSYNFSFRCNASTLTDALKYDKRSGNTNQVQWY